MIMGAPGWRIGLAGVGSRPKRFRLSLFVVGSLVIVAALFFCGPCGRFSVSRAMEPGDLLLLNPESMAKVQAAAEEGDPVAQQALGSAYLQGRSFLQRNVTTAVDWLRKVADRDRSELDRIQGRMRDLVEKRRQEMDPDKQRAIDLDYLDLAYQRRAFERAFLELIQVYTGRHGPTYANAELARKYAQSGAACGLASAQRILGIAYRYGLFGVPRNPFEGTRLLRSAAARGDRFAQWLLAADARHLRRQALPLHRYDFG